MRPITWANAKCSSAITASETDRPSDPVRRRATLGLLGLAGIGLLAPSPVRAATKEAESESDLVARAERYFDEIETLQSRFIQTNPDGTYVDGTIKLQRPGRMHIEYAAESGLEVVANGTFFILIDHRLEEVTYLPLQSTPAHLLLRENFTLGEEIVVDGVDRAAGLVRLTLRRAGEEDVGSVTVTLNADPMQLRQWVIEDQQGRLTRVTLLDPRFGVRFDPATFEFANPYGPGPDGADR